MDQTGQQLLRLLFNEGESVSVSNNEFGFQSIPLETALNGPVPLISPNENVSPSSCSSSAIILTAINPINGFRRDENVTAFRTFLWEIDVGSIKEQIGYLAHSKVPISAQVFSGNKSVHAVTVLAEDLPDEKTYRYLDVWALNILTMCDDKCKNPSRSVRVPGALRDTGKKQRLISIGERVPIKDFMDWLMKYEHLRPKVREKREIPEGEPDFDRLSPWARGMLSNGIQFRNGRNQTWFGLGVDFALAGYSEEQTIDILGRYFQEEHDFKEREWLVTIRSAFKYEK